VSQTCRRQSLTVVFQGDAEEIGKRGEFNTHRGHVLDKKRIVPSGKTNFSYRGAMSRPKELGKELNMKGKSMQSNSEESGFFMSKRGPRNSRPGGEKKRTTRRKCNLPGGIFRGDRRRGRGYPDLGVGVSYPAKHVQRREGSQRKRGNLPPTIGREEKKGPKRGEGLCAKKDPTSTRRKSRFQCASGEKPYSVIKQKEERARGHEFKIWK